MTDTAPPAPPPARLPLSLDRIVTEAIALADDGGIEALSMRKLAQRLGVEAMSLYNYVASKEILLAHMAETVVAGFAAPREGGEWKPELRRRSMTAHRQLIRHPWATALLAGRPMEGAAMRAYQEATLACLMQAGFSLAEAETARRSLDGHLYGFTLQELARDASPAPVDPAAFPLLHALSGMTEEEDGTPDIGHGLKLILSGLEGQLRQKQKRP